MLYVRIVDDMDLQLQASNSVEIRITGFGRQAGVGTALCVGCRNRCTWSGAGDVCGGSGSGGSVGSEILASGILTGRGAGAVCAAVIFVAAIVRIRIYRIIEFSELF